MTNESVESGLPETAPPSEAAPYMPEYTEEGPSDAEVKRAAAKRRVDFGIRAAAALAMGSAISEFFIAHDYVRAGFFLATIVIAAVWHVAFSIRTMAQAWELSNTIVGNIAEDHGKLAEAHERSARVEDDRFYYDKHGTK